MSYKCEILADSLSPQGHRLTTFKVTYPRIIHAEMCRHRIFSRNTASSRAIPFEKMVKDVQENPFIPIAWQKDHKGMQGAEYLSSAMIYPSSEVDFAKRDWLTARNKAVENAKALNLHNVTKQLCNRLLEPFVWTTELVSGTEWENFFELRCPKYTFDGLDLRGVFKSKKDALQASISGSLSRDLLQKYNEYDWLTVNKSQAEIHIQKIAEMMWDCYNESKPKTLQSGQWHIPYGDNIGELSILSIVDNYNTCEDQEELVENAKLAIATARAARISYTTLGDNPKIDYEADIKLHDRLLESKHLSCFEHCSRAMSDYEYETFIKGEVDQLQFGGVDPKSNSKGWANNYRGFIQYRYLIENQ